MNRRSRLFGLIFCLSLQMSNGFCASKMPQADWQVPQPHFKSITESIQEITHAVQNNDASRIDDLLWLTLVQKQNIEQLLEATLVRFHRNIQQTPGYNRLLEQGAIALIQQSVLEKRAPLLQSALLNTLGLEMRSKEFFIEAIDALIQRNMWQSDYPFFYRLQQEIDQITGIEGLFAFDTFAICLKAEEAFLHAKNETLYLRRSDHALARSLIVDKKQKTFSILSKKYGSFQAEGAFKRVSNAIFVAIDDKQVNVKRMVRVVNKIEKELSQREIAFELEYGNVKTMISYPAKSDPAFIKTSYIQEAYEHDLYQFTAYVSTEKRKMLSIDDLADIFLQIASEILYMHNKGAIHRDIKAKNILFRRDENGKIQIKICDYGHALYPENKHSKRARPKKHGTLRYSPPELLENKVVRMSQFDLLKSLDMYGLANIMYELITVEPTSWGTYVWRALKKTGKRAEEAKKEALLRQKKEYKNLMEQTKHMPGSTEKYLLQLCAKLLDPNPKTRMTSDACVAALLSIKNGFELKEA